MLVFKVYRKALLTINFHNSLWILGACLLADWYLRGNHWYSALFFSCALLVLQLAGLALEFFIHRLVGIEINAVTVYPASAIFHSVAKLTVVQRVILFLTRPACFISIGLVLLPCGDFAARLGLSSLVFAGLNLLPIHPLSGATLLAGFVRLSLLAQVGLAGALLLGLLGLLEFNPTLTIWAIILAAVNFRVAAVEKLRLAADKLTAADVMIPASKIECFSHGTSIDTAISRALRSFQDLFPVVLGSDVTGVIDRDRLLQAAASGENQDYVPSLMTRGQESVAPETPVSEVLLGFSRHRQQCILVLKGTELCGLIVEAELIQILLLQKNRRADAAAEVEFSD